MKKTVLITPETEWVLARMGEQIGLARKARKITASMVAERAAVSRSTVWAVEKGNPAVAIGAYAAVLHAIGMRDDLLLVAGDDKVGRVLREDDTPQRVRTPKREG